MSILSDPDPSETSEWIDALRAVVHYQGPERAAYVLTQLREEARKAGAMPPFLATTPYLNTIRPKCVSQWKWDATRSISARRSILRERRHGRRSVRGRVY